jgi:hypothetical protein
VPHNTSSPIKSHQETEAEDEQLLVGWELPKVVDNVLRVAIPSARTDATKYREFDLCEFYLPPTPFSPNPIPLVDRPELVSILERAVAIYGARTSPEKSWHESIGNATRTLCKLFEYSWLNGLYSISDWTSSDFSDLSDLLAQGGWAKALRIPGRTKEWVERIGRDQLLSILPSTRGRDRWSLGEAFNQALGTNVRSRELLPAKAEILNYLAPRSSRAEKRSTTSRTNGLDSTETPPSKPLKTGRSFESGMGESQLRQELGWINLIGDIFDNPPIAFVPYPNAFTLSKELGRTTGRTDNLSPDHIAKILVDAKWWLDEIAPHALALSDLLANQLIKSSTGGMGSKAQLAVLRTSDAREAIEQALGVEITTVCGTKRAPHSTVNSVVGSVYTACFSLLAFLNARRKDELIHRRYGLSKVALTPVNRAIGLFSCDFYIEKTYRTYTPFFIASLSVRAIETLDAFSDIARRIRENFSEDGVGAEPNIPDREDILFEMPRFNEAGAPLGQPKWYTFDTEGVARDFLQRALGKDVIVRVAPHMYRRGYALIFHYRYEIESIHALSHQLGHFDLTRVWRYVTDAADGATGPAARDYAKGGSPAERAREADLLAIERDIRAIGDERVRELVADVVKGTARANVGFQRLVLRFHQRLGRRLTYRELAAEEQAKVIADSLVARGHSSHPMPHVNCLAARGRRNRGAKCYSSKIGGISRQDAEPSLCGGCAYGSVRRGHVSSIELDLGRSRARLASMPDPSSLGAIALRKSIDNGTAMVTLLRTRLGMGSGPALEPQK